MAPSRTSTCADGVPAGGARDPDDAQGGPVTQTHTTCPQCGSRRDDLSRPCRNCGATGLPEHRHSGADDTIREEDLEPYVALRYIARLFKVLAGLILVMLLG